MPITLEQQAAAAIDKSMNRPSLFDGPPEPLPDSLRPVEPFDLDLLPDTLRPWIEDIAERMQCPVDYLGATAIAALAVVVGRRVAVRPRRSDDWTVVPNMWCCIVGSPGVMKSPAQSAVLDPLRRLDAMAYDEYVQAKAEHDLKAEIVQMRKDAKRKQVAKDIAANPRAMVDTRDLGVSDDPEPQMRRYLVQDATVERLAEICAANPQGVGVFRDELVSLLRGLDRDGQEGARGFYLTGWNGDDGYMVDRIMRGHSRVEAVCLSVIGSTQPGRISEYLLGAVKDSSANDGLVQRFGLLVWPDMPKTWHDIDRWPDSDHKRNAFDLYARLANADAVTDWGAQQVLDHENNPDLTRPPFVRLDSGALDLFVQWRSRLEQELRMGDLHPALESHFSKYRKLVPSLALLLHLADFGHGDITKAAMTRALAWAHYLRSHAERAYGSVTRADLASAKALLAKIRKGEVASGFTVRDIHRKCWSRLSTPAEVEQAVAKLIEYGWLARKDVQTGGRPKHEYLIHPEVRP